MEAVKIDFIPKDFKSDQQFSKMKNIAFRVLLVCLCRNPGF